MAGDPSNASIWADADVYIGATTAPDPVDASAAFSAAWSLVGLLDGEEGFVQARDEEVNDHFAWGGILVRTSRRNYKQTHRFVALEDNTTVRDLVWPGSTDEVLIVPRPVRVRVAFETREASVVYRLIAAYEAEVVVDGDIVDQESDLTKYELLATIFPNDDGELYKRQHTDTGS